VYIHGLVRDSHGQKMSKSKGNILDPLDIIDGIDLETLVIKRTTGLMQPEMAPKIEKATRKDYADGIPAFGTDALRFTFAILASTGRDINFDMSRIEGYRNFCNKLWNASRYVLINTEGKDTGVNGGEMEMSLPDLWIFSRLQIVTQEMTKSIENYRLDLAAQTLYEFIWNDYCDWYLELTKPILLSEDSSAEMLRGTRGSLVAVLETTLRLAHPIIPFITEEIWQTVAPFAGIKGDTIMTQPYPVGNDDAIHPTALPDMEWVKTFIIGIRKIRSGYNIPPSKPLAVFLQNGSDEDMSLLINNKKYIETLAKLDSITWLEQGQEAPESATSLVGNMKILIPMAGLINKEAELIRLNKEKDKLLKETQKSQSKLASSKFVERAPKEVVDKEKLRLTNMQEAIIQFDDQISRIQAMKD